MTLGEKITDLRKKRGLSQEDLAITLGVSRQAVSKWELGDTMPDTDKIIALADYFDVTTDWLLRDIQPHQDNANGANALTSACRRSSAALHDVRRQRMWIVPAVLRPLCRLQPNPLRHRYHFADLRDHHGNGLRPVSAKQRRCGTRLGFYPCVLACGHLAGCPAADAYGLFYIPAAGKAHP